MSSSIEEDKGITGATYDNDLIGIYKALKSPGISLVLPVIHLTENQDIQVAELNGLAIFKEDKLIGFIGPEETKFFLMIMDELEGGILPIQEASDPLKTLDLEIIRCQTKHSFEYTNNQIQVTVEPQFNVALASVNSPLERLNEEDIQRIENLGEQFIIEQTSSLIKKVQSQYGSDIFGFGNLIYRKDPQLWEKLSNQWDQLFVDLDVKIEPKVSIVNTGFIRNNSPQSTHK
jgi:spore germination protein KC